jgi:hypothetical protein
LEDPRAYYAKGEDMHWHEFGPGNFGPVFGIRADHWLVHRKPIEEFVKKHRIPAAVSEHAMAERMLPASSLRGVERNEIEEWLRRRPWPGIRPPHLHLDGDIYLLTDEQWREYSQMAIKEVQEKLGRTQTISFHDMMEISETVGGL